MHLLVFLALIGVTSSLRPYNEQSSNHIRKLKEDDEDHQDYGNDDAYNDMIVNQSQLDDITTSDIEDTSRGNILTDKVQQIMETAESQAWDFYSHSPSEWTNTQWNTVFVVIVIFSLSCCCLTGCVWHKCLRDDNNEDDGDEKSLCRFIRRPRIICKRRRSRLAMTRQKNDGDEKSEKSQSTTSSGSVKTFHSMEIEDDAKNKPLLEKEKSLVKKLSLKGRSSSQQATDASVKTEQCQYSRMEV
eukprot:scaffold342326_cov79-Cyclotella_meneghiniana.AAC.1